MSEPTVLNPERVEHIFRDCLFRNGEDTDSHIKVEGIMLTVGFHPERLESHRQEIETMLAELPDTFKQSGGGGAIFSGACMDRHGNQWTGMYETMDHLFMLGLGLGKVVFPLPHEVWEALPGDLPYVIVMI